MRIGEVELDLGRGELRAGGRVISLTPREAALLAHLATANAVVPKKTLATEVWGQSARVKSRAVDATLLRLRKKLPAGLGMETQRGRGVRLIIDAPAPAPTAIQGRDELLAELRQAIREPGLVGVWGPMGVGKTAIVRQLGGFELVPQELDALTRTLCEHLECSAGGLDDALRERRPLLVIDGLDARPDGTLELARRWSRACPVLVVGRAAPAASTLFEVSRLAGEHIAEILATWTGHPTHEVAAFADHAHGLPGRARRMAQSIMEVGLEDAQRDHEALEATITALSEDARRVLFHAALFEASFDLPRLAIAMDAPPFALLGAVESLWSAALLSRNNGVFTLTAEPHKVREHLPEGDTIGPRLRVCNAIAADHISEHGYWVRHYADLRQCLALAPDTSLLRVGLALLDHQWRPVALGDDLLRFARRDGHLRPLIALLRMALDWKDPAPEELRGVLDVQAPTPGAEALRLGLAARLERAPSTPAASAIASLPLVDAILLVSNLGYAGWRVPMELAARLANAADRSGLPDGARRMYSWAYIAAVRRGDPGDASRHGARAGATSKITALRRFDGDIRGATRLAETMIAETPQPYIQTAIRGLDALFALADGDVERARDRVVYTGSEGNSVYGIAAASALLKQDTRAPIPQWDDLFARWVAGDPADPDGQDYDFSYALALAMRARPYQGT